MAGPGEGGSETPPGEPLTENAVRMLNQADAMDLRAAEIEKELEGKEIKWFSPEAKKRAEAQRLRSNAKKYRLDVQHGRVS